MIISVTLIIIFVMAFSVYFILYSRKETGALRQKVEKLEDQLAEKNKLSDSLQLIKKLLENLNCRYYVKEEGRVEFSFHGDDYYILYADDSAWCRLIEYVWYECPLGDVDEFSCMQKAINNVNYKRTSTACYSIDKKDNKMYVFSKFDFILFESMPAVEEYFKVCLGDMAELKQRVVIEFEKEKQKMGIE